MRQTPRSAHECLGGLADSFEPAGHGEHGAAGTPVLSVRDRRGRRSRGCRRLRRHGRWHPRAASRSPRSSLPSGRPPAVDGHAGRGIPRRLVRRGVGRHDPRRPCGWQERGRGAGSTGTRQGRSDRRARGPAGPLVRRGRSDRRINALGRKSRRLPGRPTPSACRCWPERDSIGSATRVPIASSMPSWEYRPRWCSSRPRRTGYASSRPAGGDDLGGTHDHRGRSPAGRRSPPASARRLAGSGRRPRRGLISPGGGDGLPGPSPSAARGAGRPPRRSGSSGRSRPACGSFAGQLLQPAERVVLVEARPSSSGSPWPSR